MSANVTKGDFVFDYVALLRPRAVGGRMAMLALIAVLFLALAAGLLQRNADTSADTATPDVLMVGP